MPQESRGAFNIGNAMQMLSKLGREISRLHTERRSVEDVTDVAINAAFTAWHIHDWVWVAKFRDDTEAQIAIGINETDLRDAKREFQKYVTGQCAGLALCQDVTNGIKHVTAKTPKRRQVPAVAESRVSAGAETVAGDGYYTFTVMSLCVPKIVDDDGNTHRAADVLKGCHDYWAEFFRDHDID